MLHDKAKGQQNMNNHTSLPTDFTQVPNTLQHLSSFDSYIRHGWKLVPIPSGTKGPTTKDWNKPENALKRSNDLPPNWGVGLGHAYSGTMALDIDHWGRAVEEFTKFGIDLDALYAAPDAVIIDSGKQGHGKLLYRMPDGLVLPSKKLIDADDKGAKFNYIDFRCAAKSGNTVQDVLPPSIHPETQQPYRWAGHGKWTNLPEIPANLLTFWQALIAQDDVVHKSKSTNSGEVNWEEITNALNHISPDISRDEWVHIGMALFWAGHQSDSVEHALNVWDTWSASSQGANWEGKAKYQGRGDLQNVWNSLRLDGDVITTGTLFDMAISNGYKRPAPDVSGLFRQTDVQGEPVVEELINVVDILYPPAPQVNIDLFPPILAQRAKELKISVNCDPLVPLFAGLGAVCAALDSRTRLELMPGFKVPPVLWLMIIGDPSYKKSPGSKPMLDVLRQLEKEDRPRFKNDMLNWEGIEAAHVSSKKSFLDYAADPTAHVENDAIPVVHDLPQQPIPMKLTVSDITSQKLVRTVADRPRGVLCYLDEMNSWINKMTSMNSGEDRSTWVQAYEASHYEMERVGAGSIYSENFAVSLYGNIQPTIFKDSLQKLAGDGLLQRFIPGVLQNNENRVGTPIPESQTNTAEWENMIRTIYSLPEILYRLSDAAYKSYRAFQHWYEDEKFTERLLTPDPVFMTAFGKLEGLVGRLALIWHVQENPYDVEVPDSTMIKVIEFVKTYVIPSLRYSLGDIGGLVKDTLDHWLTEHIIQNADLETISLRELKHSARRPLAKLGSRNNHQSNDLILGSMITLEHCKWVTVIESSRMSTTWAINPELKTTFKYHREAVINAKQARLDSNRATALKGGKRSERRYTKGFTPE